MDNFSISYLHRLLNRIWNEECIQEDWHAQRTPRKATKKKKLLCVTTVERNYPLIFRQERLCVDQIATLRIIIFIEWQTFDSGPPTLGNPQTLWNPAQIYKHRSETVRRIHHMSSHP